MRGSCQTVYVPIIALVQRFYYHLIYSRLKHSFKKSFNQFTFLVIHSVKQARLPAAFRENEPIKDRTRETAEIEPIS